ncbi:MAG: phosphatase PAP2 family protein, partial [Chitinophagaceae bacterium]
QGWYIIGGTLFTFAMGDMLASRLFKNVFARIRPCNDPSLFEEMIRRVPCGTGFSFPSAHATNHFAIAIFVILVFYKYWKPVLPIGLLWAVSISFAQVYVGVHYPVDVTVGMLLGTSIGFGVHRLFKLLKPEL